LKAQGTSPITLGELQRTEGKKNKSRTVKVARLFCLSSLDFSKEKSREERGYNGLLVVAALQGA
jgi:hypothetical protein